MGKKYWKSREFFQCGKVGTMIEKVSHNIHEMVHCQVVP